jgi:mycofactocin precursor
MSERAPTADITEAAGQAAEPELAGAELASTDLLVEEVSIDGMCGVY